jgi:UDP-glucose 4-epimerase
MTHILITGATGVLGSEIAAVLLRQQEVQLHLLIRANSDEQLRQRLSALLAYWNVDARDAAGRVHAHSGDLHQPRLGIAERDYEDLAPKLTHIIHSAGVVRLNEDLAAARRHAVDGLQHILGLAWSAQRNGQFQKLDVVSTVGVAGRTSGLIPEERLAIPPAGFRNTYEQAKAEAEQLLWTHVDRGLPATVHRPSMIVGDSQTGRILVFQVFYYLCEFLSGRRTFGIVPRLDDARLDIVPVDFVATAIATSCLRPDTSGRVFHLCSGPQHALELEHLVHEVRRLFLQHGHHVPPLRRCSPATFRMCAAMLARITTGRTRSALKSLPHFLAYLADQQTFDNHAIQRCFNLSPPSPSDYLQSVIARYLETHPEASSPQATPSRQQPARRGLQASA